MNGLGCYIAGVTTCEQAISGILEQRRASAGLLLALLGQTAMRRLRDAHTAHHLSPRQFHLLGLLHDHGPMGQQELGQTMGVDPSVLVTLLNPLEADGYVSRQRASADRRRHVVALNPAGAAHLAAAAHAQRAAEDELFTGLDQDQREQLRQLLLALQASHQPDQASSCTPPAADQC
jgi:DNA-binding MarR family transcriptional regulator